MEGLVLLLLLDSPALRLVVVRAAAFFDAPCPRYATGMSNVLEKKSGRADAVQCGITPDDYITSLMGKFRSVWLAYRGTPPSVGMEVVVG